MATLQTSIRLNDGMSPALRAIHSNLEAVVNSFEAVQRATGQAVDTTRINAARDALNKTATQLDRVEQEINQNTNAQNRFNNSVKSGSGIVGSLIGKVTTMVGAYMGVHAVGGIIKTADQLQMTKARLDLMNDGLQSTEELQNKIHAAAQRSRGEYAATADAVAKLGLRAGSIFKSNDETIQFTETLNKMFVIAGASQAEMSSATLQLTQALGSGVLRGEEFNAVFEAAPNVMQAVADHIGQPIGALKELASEGKISAQVVKDALFAATDKVNEQFNNMPQTFAQAWTELKNNMLKSFQPILQGLSDITSSERFQNFVSAVGTAIDRMIGFFRNVETVVMPILAGVYDMVAAIANFFIEKWDLIAPIVWGVVFAMAAYKTVALACAIISGVAAAIAAFKAFQEKVGAAALAMMTGATFAQTAAQTGLNAALLACPITWIVLAIIALIVVFYLAVAAVNHFAGTSYSATGFICSLFMGLYTSIYNNIANLWNVFASFAEFLINLFIDPVWAIKKLFVDLATLVLDNISAMASGWTEHARGVVEVMTKAINGVLSCYNAFANSWLGRQLGISSVELTTTDQVVAGLNRFNDKIVAAKASLQSWLGAKPENTVSIARMELKNHAEELAKGYNWGAEKATQAENFMKGVDVENIAGMDKVNELLAKADASKAATPTVTDPTGGAGDVGKALDNALADNPALKDIANNTGDMSKTLESLNSELKLSDEEMNYVRKLASRETLNAFTRNNINVTMTNNQAISKDVDVDAVSKEIAKQIQQEIMAGSEGLRR